LEEKKIKWEGLGKGPVGGGPLLNGVVVSNRTGGKKGEGKKKIKRGGTLRGK